MKRALVGLVFPFVLLGCVARPLPIGEPRDGGSGDVAPVPTIDLRSPADLASSGIGAPCQSFGGGGGMLEQGSCVDGQLCVPEEFGFPEGYCVQACDAATACPGDATCVDVGDGNQFCFDVCTTASDCRDGYTCDPEGICFPQDFGEEGEVTPGTRDGGACETPVVNPTPGRFGANVLLSQANDFAAEVQLAVDPTSKHIVVSWINFNQTSDGLAFATSTDDGASFSAPAYLPKNDGVSQSSIASDPVVAVDTKGAFYVVWIGYDQDPMTQETTNMNVFVARSDDGGSTFESVFRVTPLDEWEIGGIDKPWISASPVDGSVWITWQVTDFASGDSRIRMARTMDQGKTWTVPVTVNQNRSMFYRNLAMIRHDESGRAYVVWTEVLQDALGDVDNRVYLQAFGKDGVAVGSNVRVSAGMDSPTFEDASIVARGDQVYVGFISGNASGAWDVRVAKSDDQGATFSPTVKVNDDVSCATHFHHTLAIGADGQVHALWYDNRYLVGNVFYAHSTNAPGDALVFSPNTFANDASFEFTTSRSSELWLGDYLGLTLLGSELYGVWTDPRDGLAAIRFAKGTVE